MRVYLAGPMRGLPDWNFPEFERIGQKWREAGHTVFSPASVAVALGYGLRPRLVYEGQSPDTERAQPTTEEGRAHLQHVMLSDVASLFASEAIALLPGWENSVGSTVELALAQFLGLLVYDADTMEQISPPKKPWNDIKTLRKTWGVNTDWSPPSRAVQDTVARQTMVCSHCKVPLTSDDEAIVTADSKQFLLLCRSCYNKAGNTVR